MVRSGLTKLAVYKDDQGKEHELSAVCPHMGVHRAVEPRRADVGLPVPRVAVLGSTGKVLHGPATTGLKRSE